MRYGHDDKFWVVVNPSAESEMADILFEASLRSLELQFRGGLSMAAEPAMFTEREEAEKEARTRMLAVRVSRLIAEESKSANFDDVKEVSLLDGDGNVVMRQVLSD